MGVIITGDVLGDERRNGTLDNGQPWNVHELVLLDGIRTTKVRLEKFQGSTPGRGEFAALECEEKFGKFHALRRVEAIEQLYTKPTNGAQASAAGAGATVGAGAGDKK